MVIVGAGSYGQVYASYIRTNHEYNIVGFLDDAQEVHGALIDGIRVLGPTSMLCELASEGVEAVFVPIGDNQIRQALLQTARDYGLSTPSFIHKAAIVADEVDIGRGVYILPHTVVMPFAYIDDGCMLSVGSIVAHHATLEPGVFVSHGVNIGANTRIGTQAVLGAGSTIMINVQVGPKAVVGAGSVVIRNVPTSVTVAGVPARILD